MINLNQSFSIEPLYIQIKNTFYLALLAEQQTKKKVILKILSSNSTKLSNNQLLKVLIWIFIIITLNQQITLLIQLLRRIMFILQVYRYIIVVNVL